MGRIPKGRILVEMDEAEMTAGGIILTSGQRKSNIGTVRQSGISLVPEGSKVALQSDGGTTIQIDGKEYVSATEKAIILITK